MSVAIVTGAGRGIGEAIARRLDAAGYAVAPEGVERVAADIGAPGRSSTTCASSTRGSVSSPSSRTFTPFVKAACSGGALHAVCDAPPLMATSPFEAADRAARVWAPLLLLSAVAWLAVIRDEGAAVGLMGLSAAGYVGAWVVMTTAMMLPSLAWFGSVYVRGIKRDASGLVETARTLSLAAGYLVVWSATAIGALALAWSFDRLLENSAGVLPWIGGAVLVIAGAYQLSPTKRRCLARCRSPLSFALSASRHGGRFRDFKVGLEHGAWCVACCGALMATLVVVGTMSIAWMAAIAAVVLLERSLRHGESLARAVGVALVLVGVLAPFLDWLVPALHDTSMDMGQR